MSYKWFELIAVLGFVMSIISISILFGEFLSIRSHNKETLRKYNERISKE